MAAKLKRIINILMLFIDWKIYNTHANYCVVKKALANAQNWQTVVNDKEILKERKRSNKRVMVILLSIAGACLVLVSPNLIIWVILNITGSRNIANTSYRICKYAARIPYFFPRLNKSIHLFIYY